MKIIAIIGASTTSNAIAHVFAQSGFTVKLIANSEKKLDNGMTSIYRNLDLMVSKGIITEEDKFKTIGNIITYTDIEDGVVAADLVIEPSTESIEIKENIFKRLNTICSHHTFFAMPNNFIQSISNFIAHPERIIGLDFLFDSNFNSQYETNTMIKNLSQKLD